MNIHLDFCLLHLIWCFVYDIRKEAERRGPMDLLFELLIFGELFKFLTL